MRRDYFQVVGSGTWCIDHPNGDAKAYRPGQIFEASPLNPSVDRGLRTNRLRVLSAREQKGLKNALAVQVAQSMKAAAPVAPAPKPAPKPKSSAKSSSKPKGGDDPS